jgi:hypothetical protein
MGSSENRHFARDEAPELGEYFSRVTKRLSRTGKSKLLSCVKSKDPDTAQPAE